MTSQRLFRCTRKLRQRTYIHSVFLVMLLACADEPTPLGVSLIPKSDLPVFTVDTLYPTGVGSVRTIISTISGHGSVPTWSPSTILLGSQQSLLATSYVRFTLLPDSMQGVRILGAEMSLFDRAVYGDSLGLSVPQVTMHRGRGYWAGDSLTMDSVSMQPGAYFDPNPLPPGVPVGSVDSGATTFPLDTGMVAEWFTSTIDTGTNNRGVYMTASPGNSIRGFWSFATTSSGLRPLLRVQYEKDGTVGVFEHRTGFARYLATIPEPDLILDPAKIYLQSGVSYRGLLTFDVGNLPTSISVNSSVLELTLDSSASSLTDNNRDSVFAFGVSSDGSADFDFVDESSVTSDPSGRTYKVNTTFVVLTWVRFGSPASIMVAGYTENSSLERFVFHGLSAPASMRPRLIVTYSRIQKRGETGDSK